MVDALTDYEYTKPADATSYNSASLTSFPAFVRLEQGTDSTGTGAGGLSSDASIDGIEDFGFFDENGNPLDFYAVTVDHTNDVYEFWVRVDIVRDGGTEIQVGYGSGSTDDSSAEATIWDNVPNTIARWALNESSGSALDSTSNNNDGTINGATQGASALFDTGYSFNGSSDDVNFGDVDAIDGLNQITVSGWVKPDSVSRTEEAIFHKETVFRFMLYSGDFAVRFNDGNGNWTSNLYANTSLSTGNWYHLMATYDASAGEVRLYVNGVLENTVSTSTAGLNSNSNPTYLGEGVGGNDHHYDGVIDEFSVHSGVLSDAFAKSYYDMSSEAGYTLFSWNASEQTVTYGGVRSTTEASNIFSDSFEDQDMSEYTAVSNGGSAAFPTSPVYDGTYSLYNDGSSGDWMEFYHSSETFSAPVTYSAWMRGEPSDDDGSDQYSKLTAYDGASSTQVYGVGVWGGNFILFDDLDGTSKSGVSLSQDTWHKYELEIKDSEVIAKVYDASGGQLDSLSYSRDDGVSGFGIGIRNSSYQDRNQYVDLLQATKPGAGGVVITSNGVVQTE